MHIEKEYINNHIEELIQIWLQSNIDAHDFIPKQYWEKNIPFVKQALPNAMLFCEGNETIKGFLGVSDGLIEGLFVKKEFRRKGIGKNLIQQVKKQFDVLSLYVYVKNENAVAFYKNMGFVVEKQQIQTQTGENEYFMTWKK